MLRTSSSSRPAPPPDTVLAVAFALLARRDLSEGEMRERLGKRGFHPPEIEPALARLRKRHYLDDRALALAVARRRAERKCQGPHRVRQILRQRRIAGAVTDEVIAEVFSNGAEARIALRALRRLPGTGAERRRRRPREKAPGAQWRAAREAEGRLRRWQQRQFRRLLGRGFSREAARRAVEQGAGSFDEPGGGALR